jgi:hypothetical protein
MPLYNTKMQVERDKLLEQVKKIIKHLRSSGGDFGDSNITNERNIYRSMTQALKDIGKYCNEFSLIVFVFFDISAKILLASCMFSSINFISSSDNPYSA